MQCEPMRKISGLLEKYVHGFTRIRSQLITMETILRFYQRGQPLFIQAHTGTGKTWLIVMVALYVLMTSNKSVIVTAPNNYLATRSYNLFKDLFDAIDVHASKDVVADRISFVTPEAIERIDHKEKYVLIIDEVDQESFNPIIKRNRAVKQFVFKPTLHSAFSHLIGFSGSIGGNEEWDALCNLYQDPILLKIPRLQDSQTPKCLFVEAITEKEAWLKRLVSECSSNHSREFLILILDDDDDIVQAEEALRKKGLPTRVFNQFH